MSPLGYADGGGWLPVPTADILSKGRLARRFEPLRFGPLREVQQYATACQTRWPDAQGSQALPLAALNERPAARMGRSVVSGGHPDNARATWQLHRKQCLRARRGGRVLKDRRLSRLLR